MSFAKQATAATFIVGASVAGLMFLGRSDPTATGGQDAALPAEISSPVPLGEPALIKSPRPASLKANSARALVPANAWIVADFRGDLTGHLPFADKGGECENVPAPPRVAAAILPPLKGHNPELLISAPQVSDRFWACAVERIESAGGGALAQNELYEVFKSPSGLVARGPEGSMMFLSGESHLESALSVLSQLSPSAATEKPHAPLHDRLHPEETPSAPTALDLTLSLPDDWLSAVGQDADRSPLRHLKSAFVSLQEDHSAQGGVVCEETGCAEFLAFLLRAQGDLLARLPAADRAAIQTSLKAEHVAGTGRIVITWTPSDRDLSPLFSRFFDLVVPARSKK